VEARGGRETEAAAGCGGVRTALCCCRCAAQPAAHRDASRTRINTWLRVGRKLRSIEQLGLAAPPRLQQRRGSSPSTVASAGQEHRMVPARRGSRSTGACCCEVRCCVRLQAHRCRRRAPDRAHRRGRRADSATAPPRLPRRLRDSAAAPASRSRRRRPGRRNHARCRSLRC
jgi:hypothetical protein